MKFQKWNWLVLVLAVVVVVSGVALGVILLTQRPAGTSNAQNPPAALSTPDTGTNTQSAQVTPATTPPATAGATAPAGNVAPSGPAITSTVAPDPTRLITVISVGTVKAVPDIAYLNVGSQVQAVTASEAMTKASAISDAIYKTLLAQGVPENSIQTSGINIYPIMDNTTSKTILSGPSGYHASFNMSVSITDMSKVGPVLDSVTKAGANQISGLSYGFKDATPLKAQALEQALKAAEPKAQAIATSLGVKIDQVMAVSEDTTGYYDQPGYGMGGQSAAAPVISPGELTVSVQVHVSYSIR